MVISEIMESYAFISASTWMGDCLDGCSSFTMLFMQVDYISTKSLMRCDIIMTYHDIHTR